MNKDLAHICTAPKMSYEQFTKMEPTWTVQTDAGVWKQYIFNVQYIYRTSAIYLPSFYTLQNDFQWGLCKTFRRQFHGEEKL